MLNKNKIFDELNSIEEFDKILEVLLKKLDLTNIRLIDKHRISANSNEKLETKSMLFIATLSKLNGKIDFLQRLISEEKKDKISLIYIITSSNTINEYFKNWIRELFPYFSFSFWGRSDIIKKIDEYYEDFWYHNDHFIKPYQDMFISKLKTDFELRSILKLGEKYDKLLDIFIEPKLYIYKEDFHSGRTIPVFISKSDIISKDNYVITGDAGTGKSTLLKEIGKDIIRSKRSDNKITVPIFIKHTDLFDNNFSLEQTISSLLSCYSSEDIELLYSNYSILLLMDSIDELEKNNQLDIINQVIELNNKTELRYVFATRNYDYFINKCKLLNHERIEIHNFDIRQIKAFLDSFFRYDLSKSSKLWKSLDESNIFNKMPVTPLTLSLISILFEENQYEIPATITDIFHNFNLFLLGRATVKSRLDFLNITIKERILCLYALDILKSLNRKRKTQDEFIDFISEFFRQKNIKFHKELIPELLNSLTEGTGILYLDDNNRIDFKHDYFMEYYASLEIFNHNKNFEANLISNFTKFNWQNTAIFYAGITKDMPDFLESLLKELRKSNTLVECLISISGLGSILQSLWLTDAVIRKDGVKVALDLLLIADQKVKELSSSEQSLFSGFNQFKIAIINLAWFYTHFNSITLKDPLSLAFNDINERLSRNKYSDIDILSIDFQLFCLAMTLNSDRLNDVSFLETLIDKADILSKPLFVELFSIALNLFEPKNTKQLLYKNKIKGKIKKYREVIRLYISEPSDRLRLTSFDSIRPIKEVEIFTEGKSDAIIITHAFKVLTDNKNPYWNIQSCQGNNKSGGANNLTKKLIELSQNTYSTEYTQKKIMGIFDNDSKGFQEFNGLKNDFISYKGFKTIKKHSRLNIFAILLPIPPEKDFIQYNQDKQNFKFFEIEHYFPLSFLTENHMTKETSIPGVFEIVSNKTKFSKLIEGDSNPDRFFMFRYLFNVLDDIFNKKNTYFDRHEL